MRAGFADRGTTTEKDPKPTLKSVTGFWGLIFNISRNVTGNTLFRLKLLGVFGDFAGHCRNKKSQKTWNASLERRAGTLHPVRTG